MLDFTRFSGARGTPLGTVRRGTRERVLSPVPRDTVAVKNAVGRGEASSSRRTLIGPESRGRPVRAAPPCPPETRGARSPHRGRLIGPRGLPERSARGACFVGVGALVRGRHADTGDIWSPSRSTSAARAAPARRRWASRPPTSRAWPSGTRGSRCPSPHTGARTETERHSSRSRARSRPRWTPPRVSGCGRDGGAVPASGDSMATVSAAAAAAAGRARGGPGRPRSGRAALPATSHA